jgi:hypothetical protein
VTAVVRDGDLEINPGPELTVEAGDILVLIGKPDQIRTASEFIKEGEANTEATAGKTEPDERRFSTLAKFGFALPLSLQLVLGAVPL